MVIWCCRLKHKYNNIDKQIRILLGIGFSHIYVQTGQESIS